MILAKVVDGRVLTLEEAANLPYKEKCRLIKTDPITCSNYFDYRFRKFNNLVLNKMWEEHKVVDTYFRYNFTVFFLCCNKTSHYFVFREDV